MNPISKNNSEQSCRICLNSSNNKLHKVGEMMYGSGKIFNYLECASCGTLQLIDIPDTLQSYYTKSYAAHIRISGIRAFLARRSSFYHWGRFCPIGFARTILSGRNIAIDALKFIKAQKAQSLLDVGCGSGELLRQLYNLGFRSIEGIDPYVSDETIQIKPFPIRRKTLGEIKGTYDLIVFNHTFEHMPNPGVILTEMAKHLNPHGTALILIPVAGCAAWKEYGTKWVQIDAPRHLFLHTYTGLKILCQQAGLTIDNILWNSTEFQIVGSKQCLKGIPLVASNSIYSGGIIKRIKLLILKARLNSKISKLNNNGTGDQACFIVRKKADEKPT